MLEGTGATEGMQGQGALILPLETQGTLLQKSETVCPCHGISLLSWGKRITGLFLLIAYLSSQATLALLSIL